MKRNFLSFVISTIVAFVALLTLEPYAFAGDSEGPVVWIDNLNYGDTVTSPVKIIMKVNGMTVAKAGVMDENTGHHHIIVDGAPVDKGNIIIADATHIHFGNGQEEAELTLTPGKHTLTLQFADGLHRSYGPELSSSIEINVEETPKK